MHHRVRGAILGTIAALVLPQVALAQGEGADVVPNDDAPAPADEAGAPAPETAVPEPAELPPPNDPLSRAGVTWRPFGYMRMQYRIVQNDPNVAFIGRNDGFELQNARIGVIAAYKDRMRFVVALEGAISDRAQLNLPEGRLRDGLRDAYVDVAIAGDLAVRAGYFRTLVDPDIQGDNLEGDTLREFVDRPIESRGVRATEGYETPRLTPGRSIGAALRLDRGGPVGAPAIGFEVAVQNGADELASDNDNDTPAVSASVLARFPRDSWVVASARFNRRTEGELPFRQDEDDLQASLGARVEAGPVTLGGGAMLTRTSFPTVGSPVSNSYGAHAQLAVRIPGPLPIAVGYRFGILDASSLIVTDRVMEHTAAAVLAVPAYRFRVQLQVVHTVEQESRTLTNDRIQLAGEIAL